MDEELIAREDEQDRFRSVLAQFLDRSGQPDEGYLVLVHGLGGVGKTALCQRYKAIVEGAHEGDEALAGRTLTAHTNFEHEPSLADFGRSGPPLWRVLQAIYFAVYRSTNGNHQARAVVERQLRRFRELAKAASTEAPAEQPPDGGPSEPTEAAIGAIAALASLLGHPEVGVPAAKSAPKVAKAVGYAAKAKSRFAKGTVGSDDLRAALRPEEALAEAFAAGLREVSRLTRPVVVLLDTAEILGDTRAALVQVIRESGSRCLWVVAMRLQSDDPDDEVMSDLFLRTLSRSRLRTVEPSRFTKDDVVAYLRDHVRRHDQDSLDVDAAMALTRGIPLAVKLLARLLNAGASPAEAVQSVSSTGDVSKVVVGLARRYLIHVTRKDGPSDPDLDLIYGLALARRDADPHVLAALWDIQERDVATTQDRLARQHDFVLRRGRLHEDVEHAVRLFLLQPSHRVAVKDANRRAVAVLQHRLAALGWTTTAEALDDSRWRAAAVALLWHVFWIDEADGLHLLAALVLAADSFRPALVAQLFRVIDPLLPALSEEVRTAVAGLQVLLTTSPLVSRIADVFRSKAPGAGLRPLERATATLERAAARADSVTPGDLSTAALLAMVKARRPTLFALKCQDGQRGLVAVDAELPAPGTQPSPAERAWAASVDAYGRYVLADESGDNAVAVQAVVDLATRAAARDPGRHGLWKTIYNGAGKQGDVALQLRACSTLAVLEPDGAMHHQNCGAILSSLGHDELALEAFVAAAVCEPEAVGRHVVVLHLAFKTGRFDVALDAIDHLISLDGSRPTSHNDRGVILSRLGRSNEAAEALTRAAELEPESPQRAITAAMALHGAGRLEDALAAGEWAAALAPDGHCHNTCGIILSQLGRYQDALKQFDKGMGTEPEPRVLASLLSNRGETLFLMGERDEAVTSFERAIEAGHPDPMIEARLLLAVATAATNRQRSAALAREVLTVDFAKSANTSFRSGEVRAIARLLAGDEAGAAEELEAVIAQQRGSDWFQAPVYDELDAAGVPGVERLVEIWGRCQSPSEDVDR